MADPNNDRAGGIHIGSVHGAFAIGDHNTVTQHEGGAGEPVRDPAQEELLQAIRRLRADLGNVVASEQTAALDAELSDAEDEIEGTGEAGRGCGRRCGKRKPPATPRDGMTETGENP